MHGLYVKKYTHTDKYVRYHLGNIMPKLYCFSFQNCTVSVTAIVLILTFDYQHNFCNMTTCLLYVLKHFNFSTFFNQIKGLSENVSYVITKLCNSKGKQCFHKELQYSMLHEQMFLTHYSLHEFESSQVVHLVHLN